MKRQNSKNRSNRRRRAYTPPRECVFTANRIDQVDYFHLGMLKQCTAQSGRILPSRQTGIKPHFQRQLKIAVRRARYLALLPYCDRHKGM